MKEMNEEMGVGCPWLLGQGADGAKGATGEYRDLPEPSLLEELSPRPQRGAQAVFGEQKEGSAGAQYSGVGAGRRGADRPGSHGPTARGGDLLPVVGTPWKLLSGKAT